MNDLLNFALEAHGGLKRWSRVEAVTVAASAIGETLVLGGRNDPLFTPAAPEALKQALPAAAIDYFDGGHFPLDEYADAMVEAIIETFSR